jgi:hypothetical protein
VRDYPGIVGAEPVCVTAASSAGLWSPASVTERRSPELMLRSAYVAQHSEDELEPVADGVVAAPAFDDPTRQLPLIADVLI